MLISMRLNSSTKDAFEAIGQSVTAFGGAFAHAGEGAAPFEKIKELAFRFGVVHPAMPPPGKGSASYLRDSGIFLAEAHLDYDMWIGDRWPDRVRAVAEAAQTALAAVHKTRLTPEERSALSHLIAVEAEKLAVLPPERLLHLKPVYALEDASGRRVSMGFESPDISVPGSTTLNVIVLQPPEIRAYVAQESDAIQAIHTVKLYKRHNRQLLYREAWVDREHVVEHVGVCGERGSTSRLPAMGQTRQREVVDAFVGKARAEGFKPVPDARLVGLLVSKEISGAGTRDDLHRRHALEDFLNDVTGWLGLGHCDGGSTGSGSMEAFCLVVDYKIAAEAITHELAFSPFSDFAVSRKGQVGTTSVCSG